MDRSSRIRLKIERAEKHIRDLKLAIHSFCNSDELYTLVPKEYPDTAEIGLCFDYIRPIPFDISLGIGDAVHNTRSALDHLVWQLVEAGGGVPNKDTYFPICHGVSGSQQFASATGKGEINKIRPGAHKVLEAIQPYITGDDTLRHLHELDRIDKHRLILTVASIMKTLEVRIELSRWNRFPQIGEPVIPGHEIIRLPMSTYKSDADQYYGLGLDIAFGQSEIVAGKPILETLNGMAKLVHNIVSGFEPFLV